VKGGRFVLIPAGPETHGHGTHTWAALWKQHLAALLAATGD
jgi:homoserine O-acetyltransferase